MKKRILLLFVTMIGLATNVGWAENDPATKITQETIGGNPYVFANGNSITVTAGTEKQTIITLTDNSETVTIEDGSNLLLFGGSKNKTVESSSITIEGGTFYDVYGGGYGTAKESSADVTNATLIINDGTFTNIFGGGHTYAKVTGKVSITINKVSFTNLSNSWICPGGREDGKTKLKYPAFTDALNSVKEAELTINGGTYGYIGVSGATGTGGYIGNVTANIKDAKINGGIYGNASNGGSNDVSAILTNCTFAENAEIASINRGHATNVNFSFIGCHFPIEGNVIANLGGAANWKLNYKGSEAVVVKPGNITYSFDSTCDGNVPEMALSDGLEDAIINVTGAKVKVASFSNGVDAASAAFTINSGATWTFNNGLEMTSDASLTGSGNLIVKGAYTVATTDQLEDAIKQEAVTDILLNNGEYTLTGLLELDKAITLSSVDPNNKATIKGYIAIKADDATVKDLNLSYERKSSLFSDKNGISVFTNKATITGNTFTTTNDGTNGIVFYPQETGSIAQEYTVTRNTFNLAGNGSTGIIVRENFKSNSQIPGVTTTASLSNGSALDQQVIASESNNVFSGMAGGYYVRVTGNYSAEDAGTGAETAITQKYIYSYVNEANVADAIASSQMGATVNAASVASSKLVEKMNALETKPALANGIKILCSDMTVYSDLANALAATTAEKVAKYIALNEGGTSYELKEAKKETPVISDENKLTASDIEVGQPLSASLLSGGSAKVDEKTIIGVFSWKDPSTKATEGSNQYDVLFTPTDQTLYTTATTTVAVKAIQYYTVTAGKCENGKVEITSPKASNKYIKNTILAVTAIPAEHYQFDKWTEGAKSYTVTQDASLVATFKAITHKVTFGENITVLNAGKAISSGAEIAEGSVLTVTAAKDGNKLTSLTYNSNKNVINNQITVDGAIAITALFEKLLPSTRLVKVDYTSDAAAKNGKVQLYDEAGNIIEVGSAVAVGKTVSVVAVPDYGYKVKANGLTVIGNEVTLTDNKFTIAADEGAITVKQVFEKRTFAVTLPTKETDHATVELSSSSLEAVPFETELTISAASASTGYKLISIIVNGKQVAVNGTFKVTAATKVNAVVEKLPAIQFTDTKQTYTYNGSKQTFVVRTTPAGISDIAISYKKGEQTITDPTDAGTYNVYATYTGKDYAEVSNNPIGTLEIKKAEWTGVAIPKTDEVTESGEDVDKYHWGDVVDKNFQKAYYKLSATLSNNYNNPEFIIPQKNVDVDEVTLNIQSPEVQNYSLGRRVALTKAETKTITFKGENGTIAIYNGPAIVGTTAYMGQTLTLKAIPNAGYSSIPTWSNNVTSNNDGTATVILTEGMTVTATFTQKKAAPITPGKTAKSTYNGVAFGSGNTDLSSLIVSEVSGWSLAIKQNDLTVEPTNAGTYDIVASRQEDEAYTATSTTIGTLSIAKATPVLTEVNGSDIIAGQTLRESVLSGTSDVQGTFSWKNPDTQMNAGNTQKATALFKSDDSNYNDTEVTATLKVTAKSDDITTRTLTLTVNNPENGKPVVTTLNGTEFTGSVSVKEKDVLKVTFEANSDCTAAATINGSNYNSGSDYTIGATGDVNVVVTFTKNEKPGTEEPGTEEPGTSETPVSGIKLDVTSKTLAVGESFTLKATVEPSDAGNKKVNWSSSNTAIATVDKDGNVKALKAGSCKITATTDDGSYTADCEITVSIATGIEELLAANRIYSSYGQIIIEPTASPEVLITDMTGRIMYYDRITEKTQVTVSGGFYLVRLSENGKATTVKVIVK